MVGKSLFFQFCECLMPFLFEGHVRLSVFGKPKSNAAKRSSVTNVELGNSLVHRPLHPKSPLFKFGGFEKHVPSGKLT